MPVANRSILAGLGALFALGLVAQSALAAPSGPPVRIGSTLALTGPLAATGLVHKIVGEIYVEQLNRKNGLLGRPVEWVLKDDQSRPDLARTLYEQLITVDKVDLIMGPYATRSRIPRSRRIRWQSSPANSPRCTSFPWARARRQRSADFAKSLFSNGTSAT